VRWPKSFERVCVRLPSCSVVSIGAGRATTTTENASVLPPRSRGFSCRATAVIVLLQTSQGVIDEHEPIGRNGAARQCSPNGTSGDSIDQPALESSASQRACVTFPDRLADFGEETAHIACGPHSWPKSRPQGHDGRLAIPDKNSRSRDPCVPPARRYRRYTRLRPWWPCRPHPAVRRSRGSSSTTRSRVARS